MSEMKQQVLDANAAFVANFGDKAKLPMPPGRRIALLTCMDARLDPAKFAGLQEGDAHVFRNAGGRATDDAIRSLVISHKLLGTIEWFVIHHTDCGMEYFDDRAMGSLLQQSLKTAQLTQDGFSNVDRSGGSPEGHFVKWYTIADQSASVCEDVARIRKHPLVSPDVTIHGFIFDVKTGKLNDVPEASAIGAA